MEEKPLTGEEVLQQILGALNGNGMQQAANGLYELCSYVDSMTHKVEDMTEEIAGLQRDYEKLWAGCLMYSRSCLRWWKNNLAGCGPLWSAPA